MSRKNNSIFVYIKEMFFIYVLFFAYNIVCIGVEQLLIRLFPEQTKDTFRKCFRVLCMFTLCSGINLCLFNFVYYKSPEVQYTEREIKSKQNEIVYLKQHTLYHTDRQRQLEDELSVYEYDKKDTGSNFLTIATIFYNICAVCLCYLNYKQIDLFFPQE